MPNHNIDSDGAFSVNYRGNLVVGNQNILYQYKPAANEWSELPSTYKNRHGESSCCIGLKKSIVRGGERHGDTAEMFHRYSVYRRKWIFREQLICIANWTLWSCFLNGKLEVMCWDNVRICNEVEMTSSHLKRRKTPLFDSKVSSYMTWFNSYMKFHAASHLYRIQANNNNIAFIDNIHVTMRYSCHIRYYVQLISYQWP